MRLENPKDVRDYIKNFIVQIGSGELEGIKQPGVIIQALNCWLKCYELERDTQIEKRICDLEKKVQEAVSHGKERERELS